MKPIETIASQVQEQIFSPDNSISYNSISYLDENNLEKIRQLLIRIGNIYGHLFTSNTKTEAMFDAVAIEWTMAIGDYSYQSLDRALERCKKEHKKTVTLPQFMDCLQVSQYQAMINKKIIPPLKQIISAKEKERKNKIGKEAVKKMLHGLRMQR